jgi:hypothetical protein
MAMTASMSVQLVPSFVPVTVMHLCPEGHAGVEAAANDEWATMPAVTESASAI